MEKLDEAAIKLLARHFPDKNGGETPPDAIEQIKAFTAVQAYFGPRTKLGPEDNKGGSAFERLRNGLDSPKTKGGRGRTAPQTNGDASGEPAGSA
jgi:hypothetical protein